MCRYKTDNCHVLNKLYFLLSMWCYLPIVSPLNPIGVKDAGEAGAIPVGPLFAQALEDALHDHDVDFEVLEIPLNSNKLWGLVSGNS